MAKKMQIETRNITPVCPHCSRELEKLIQVTRGFFSVHQVLCCPHCRKILGISSNQ